MRPSFFSLFIRSSAQELLSHLVFESTSALYSGVSSRISWSEVLFVRSSFSLAGRWFSPSSGITVGTNGGFSTALVVELPAVDGSRRGSDDVGSDIAKTIVSLSCESLMSL